MSSQALEWTRTAGAILVSWGAAGLLIALMFRSALLSLVHRWVASTEGKAEVGPLTLERGKRAEEGQAAVRNLRRLNRSMAESRSLELEITEANFGSAFAPDPRQRMNAHVDELGRVTARNEDASPGGGTDVAA